MHEGRGRTFILLIAILFSSYSFAQEIRVSGGFVEDSLLIGQDVHFWLTAAYPVDMEMIFPDSTHSFSPFEYSSKKYFTTELLGQLAFDSAVYQVQSFEIDRKQFLQLPVILLDGLDSTIITTELDSIYLMELAPVVSDTTKLQENADYQLVDRAFNYPMLYIISGALLVIGVVLLLIFGKKILRFFKLRKLRKDYENFSQILLEYINRLKSEPQPEIAENALFAWKRYQERLDKFPFTKLTTKEILDQEFNQELEKPLKSIDRLVYGHRDTETVYQDFQQIEDFAQHRYLKKVEEIKDGK